MPISSYYTKCVRQHKNEERKRERDLGMTRERRRAEWAGGRVKRGGFLGRIHGRKIRRPRTENWFVQHQIAKIAEFYAGPAISDGPIGPDDFPADSFFPMGFRYDGGTHNTPGAPAGAHDSGPYRVALARCPD